MESGSRLRRGDESDRITKRARPRNTYIDSKMREGVSLSKRALTSCKTTMERRILWGDDVTAKMRGEKCKVNA